MNALIMNYLVIEGFKDAAEKFKLESKSETLVQLDTINDRMKIRNAIQQGDIDSAIEV